MEALVVPAPSSWHRAPELPGCVTAFTQQIYTLTPKKKELSALMSCTFSLSVISWPTKMLWIKYK